MQPVIQNLLMIYIYKKLQKSKDVFRRFFGGVFQINNIFTRSTENTMYGVGEGNAKAVWRKQHTQLPLTIGKYTGLISVLFAHQLNQMPQNLLTSRLPS